MAFFATYERIWHFLPLTSVSGNFCHSQAYLTIFATYERIWHFLPLTSVSGIFCHLRAYLAFFATYERIWHILPLTSVSDIFCHLRAYLAFCATLITNISVTRGREKKRKLWQKLLSMLLISIGLSVAVLDRYLPGSADDISSDELIERYLHLDLQHSEILLFLIMNHGIVLSLRQLKRILARRALTRRLNLTDLGTVLKIPDTLVSGKKCQIRP